MLFNSFVFLIFLAIVWPTFMCLRGKRAKNLFLLLASYFFYAYWNWKFCFLLLLSTLVDFVLGLLIQREQTLRRRRLWLAASLSVNLGVLGFYKYFNFFIDSFQSSFAFLRGEHLDMLHVHVILPVGISFYTFQTLSYTLDIYRKKLTPTRNFVDFALFVSFFPQLVAGPIERASHLLPQVAQDLRPSRQQIKEGLVLVIMGLFLKVMVGDASGRIVDQIFAEPQMYASWTLLCSLVLFSIQIYADFSGYSHIARGTAKLLGVELMLNFEQPYLAANITEFWRRWHISLSTWLRDYVYIPLGGNRKGHLRTYVNLMLTMLIGGLWHGANWTFVVWGGLHGLYLMGHKYLSRGRKLPERFVYTGMPSLMRYLGSASLTYLLVLVAWLFFRAENFAQVLLFFKLLWPFSFGEYALRFGVITLSFVAITLLHDSLQYAYRSHTFLLSWSRPAIASGILGALAMTTLMYMFIEKPLPFVYFQF